MRELSLHILDIAQNSIVAGAKLIEISVQLDSASDMLTISIKDNGKGMKPGLLEQLANPFCTTRTTRRVGMGIPMFAQSAISCDGWFNVESKPGQGTQVTAGFRADHIDRMPLGDIVSTLITIVAANPEIDTVYTQLKDQERFTFDTREIKQNLQGVALSQPEVLKWIREYLTENLNCGIRIQ